MERKRIIWLDALRVFSIFCMIVLHAATSNYYKCPPHSYEWEVFSAYNGMVRFCVPAFVMISGALFLNPSKEISLKSLFRKNILRIVCAFFFWSACYAIYSSEIYANITPETIAQFIYELLIGHFHLWFLNMILGLYLIIPFMRKIAYEKRLMQYFLLLASIFTIVLPSLMALPLPGERTITEIIRRVDIQFVAGFPVYFLAGYYFYAYPIKRKAVQVTIYAMGILSAILACIKHLYSYFMPSTAFITLALFLFFQTALSEHPLPPGRIFPSKAVSRMIFLVSNCSFGIYLVHVFVIYLFSAVGFSTLSFNPVIAVPVIAISTFLCSFAISYLISKIPVLGKYIV